MKIQSQDLEHQPSNSRVEPVRRKVRGPWGLRERRSPAQPKNELHRTGLSPIRGGDEHET